MFVSLSLENCGNVGRAWRRSCSASAAHRRDLPSQVPRPSVSWGAQLGLARRKPRITHRRQHGFPPVTGRVLSGEHVPCRIWKQYKRSGMGTPSCSPMNSFCGRRASNTKCAQCACGTMQCSLIFICFAAPLEVAPPGKIIAFLFWAATQYDW